MKCIRVEFSGAAREIVKEKVVLLTLENEATYRDIVRTLAQRYPGLVGVLISEDQQSLLSANLFNRNGEIPIMPEDMTLSPQDGERILMLYFIVGG
jgi:hypothetical protein